MEWLQVQQSIYSCMDNSSRTVEVSPGKYWNTHRTSVMPWSFPSKSFLPERSCIFLPSVLCSPRYWHSFKISHKKKKLSNVCVCEREKERERERERESVEFIFTALLREKPSPPAMTPTVVFFFLSNAWHDVSIKYQKLRKIYHMKWNFLYQITAAPRSPFSLSSVLNWICWNPPEKNSWVRHWRVSDFFLLKARVRVEFALIFHISSWIVYPFVSLYILTLL